MIREIMLFGVLHFAAALARADYYVGAWVADITPTIEEAQESCLGGYGTPFSRCGFTEVRDRITVRSVSIADDDTDIIFAIIDTIGVGDSLISAIKDYVSALSAGTIKRENIIVTATHTHSGPDLQGLWGGVSPSYRERVVVNTALTILLARLTAQQTDISVFKTDAQIRNRRGWDIVDDEVNVLDIKIKGTDFRIATVINMSAHPTILDVENTSYSAGYIHFVRQYVEQALGGKAIFINGALGDLEPDVQGMRTYNIARKYGKMVANRIVKGIENAEVVDGDFNYTNINFSHPVTNEGIIAAAQSGLLDLDLDEALNVNTQFGFISFGTRVSGVTFPGEALTRFAAPIKNAMHSKYNFFFGLAGGSLGYFIPSDEYLQIGGRYTEEQACIDPFVGDKAQSLVLDVLEKVVE